jgi:hypothetical protein
MNKKLIIEKSKNLELTKDETKDLIHALEIMEKVSKAELEFAGNVLKEYRNKTIHATMGKEWVMKYPSLDEIKQLYALDQMFEITKH